MNNRVFHTGGRAPFTFFKTCVAVAALLGAATAAQAQQQASNWRFYAGAGLAHGGDTVADGTIVDPNNGHVIPFEIKPEGDWQLRVGAEYRVSDRFTLQGAIGHGNSAPMGYDGSYTMTTIPLELLGFFGITDAFRVGGGVRRTYADMAGTGKGAGYPGLGRWDTNGGAVLELQYLWSTPTAGRGPQFGISLRRVSETFSKDGYSFSGNHTELGVALYY
jgi:hypothetical protein